MYSGKFPFMHVYNDFDEYLLIPASKSVKFLLKIAALVGLPNLLQALFKRFAWTR